MPWYVVSWEVPPFRAIHFSYLFAPNPEAARQAMLKPTDDPADRIVLRRIEPVKSMLPAVQDALRSLGEPMLLEALAFATEMHAGQMRDGGEPYIEHPLRVTFTLFQAGFWNPEILMASLLHDVHEDCDVPITLLAERFGSVAAEYVRRLSKNHYPSKREAEIGAFETLATAALKAADRLDNIRSLANAGPWRRSYLETTWKRVVPLIGRAAEKFPERAGYFRWVLGALEEARESVLADIAGEPAGGSSR